MTQTTAMKIIEEASQDQRIAAELDTRRTRGSVRSVSYRVKLTLKPERLVLTIIDAEDWRPIQQAWQQL